MGVLATATSLSGASLLLRISCLGCYVMSGKSLVSKHCKHCKGASTICSIVTGLCAMPWSEEAKWWRRCWESIQHLLLQLYLELSNARRRCDYPLWQRRCWDVTGDWRGELRCKQGVPLQALDSLTSSFDWFITRGGGGFWYRFSMTTIFLSVLTALLSCLLDFIAASERRSGPVGCVLTRVLRCVQMLRLKPSKHPFLSHEARKWPMDTWIPPGYRTYQGFSFLAPQKYSCMHRQTMEPYIC